MGRLKPGVTLEQARADVKAILAREMVAHASADDRATIERNLQRGPTPVEHGARGFSYYRGALGTPLLTLMVAVALVLLVACANVASLTLVRATSRTREMGVRMALGAGRRRVVRQLLAESLVLAAVGGGLGLLLAQWGSKLLIRLASAGPRPIPLDAGLNARALAFTAALALGTALLFGIMPALRATRAVSGLSRLGRGIGAGGGSDRLPAGRVLVVAQVALSMVLLVGTAMLVRSVGKLQGSDLGFDREHTLVAAVEAGRSGYEGAELAALRRDAVARVAALPGIAAASYSENGIFSGTSSATTLQVRGFTARAEEDTIVDYDDVGPGYFGVIGARMLQGRDFDERDEDGSGGAAVLNESMARFYFGAESPIGRMLSLGTKTYEVVGVAADAEQQGLRDEGTRRLYLSMMQVGDAPSTFYLVARAKGDPAAAVEPIRQALRSVDPRLSIRSVDAVPSLIAGSIAQDRMLMRVVTFFGALAMLLAAVGLFGLMAYGAARRTSEFGLRMALGARRETLTRMMLGEALWLVALGLVLGVPIALAATRLLRSQIYGIEVVDPPSLAAAVGVLLLSALVAGSVPALRAGRVSPLESLRSE
jgi:predicted permease